MEDILLNKSPLGLNFKLSLCYVMNNTCSTPRAKSREAAAVSSPKASVPGFSSCLEAGTTDLQQSPGASAISANWGHGNLAIKLKGADFLKKENLPRDRISWSNLSPCRKIWSLGNSGRRECGESIQRNLVEFTFAFVCRRQLQREQKEVGIVT